MNKIFNIIAVDDSKTVLKIFEKFFKNTHYNYKGFINPEKALLELNQNKYDIALVDYEMPEMNGIEFIKKAKILDSELLFLMITSNDPFENSLLKNAFDVGAYDFLNKPITEEEFFARLKKLEKISDSRFQLTMKTKQLEQNIESIKEEKLITELETIDLLGFLAEFRNLEDRNHIDRVSYYSKLLAKELGESDKNQDLIFHAAKLHDIGKIGIRESILFKPAKLSKEEFEIIKTHTTLGFDMLNHSKSMYLKAAAVIALTHHEKYDGSGYPNNLSGLDIPLLGRITAVSDVLDALTSERVYKKAWSLEEAIKHIKTQSGKHFDPLIVEKLILNLDEIKKIYLKHS